MANKRATDRIWAKQTVNHVADSLEDVYRELMGLKKIIYPEWTDDSNADPGNALLHLTSVLIKFAIDYLNNTVKNCYVGTAFRREFMKRILDLINYTLKEAEPSTVTVTFTLEDGHPELTIPAGTKVGTEETAETDQVIFETSEDTLVQAGTNSVDILCIQGETISQEVIGSSDGEADQRFKLARRPVIYESDTVQVLYGTWQNWLRKADFIDSDSDDLHYRIEVDTDGYYWIIFGDGINGKIPPSGSSNIRVTYRVGGGTEGNVSADTIVELISNVDYVISVNNTNGASGGTDQETIEHARKFGPASLRTLERAVTTADYKYLAEQFRSDQFGGIAKARAKEVALSVKVYIVPSSGGAPAQGLKDELLEYLEERKVACTPVEVEDPTYNSVDITMDLYILSNYARDTVINEVRSALSNFLSPTYLDPDGLYPHEFGRDIYLSDLYQIIEGIEGVDHSLISTPTANVTVEDHEIVQLGTLDITAYQGGQEQSYLF
jgi:hypothetical protein